MPPSRVDWLQFIDAKLERLTLSCRVTWTWSESVSLYGCQIVILARTTKTYTTQSGLGALSEPPDVLICTALGPGHWHWREVSLHSSMLPSSSTLMVAGSVSWTLDTSLPDNMASHTGRLSSSLDCQISRGARSSPALCTSSIMEGPYSQGVCHVSSWVACF
jgi:hypothetical protein